MDKRTRKALEGSIRKWQRIVEWRGEDHADENCPLCKEFRPSCQECPVALRTGFSNCRKTPYGNFVMAWFDEAEYYSDAHAPMCGGRAIIGPESQAAAEAELAFLISLRED